LLFGELGGQLEESRPSGFRGIPEQIESVEVDIQIFQDACG